MTLNHLNLTVNDIEGAQHVLEKYFGMKEMGGNKKMVFLTDDKGIVLTLMKAPVNDEVRYPGSFHIGFIVESKERVNEINQQLKDDGFDVPAPKKSHAWTFYFQAPGGFTVEVFSSTWRIHR
jgi:lactoylglutathione lyase